MQVILSVLVTDEGFDFVPQQPQIRVAVDVVFPKLQFAFPDCLNNFLLSQVEFLSGGLVTQRGSLACPS